MFATLEDYTVNIFYTVFIYGIKDNIPYVFKNVISDSKRTN